jgi:4-amino-4-deoxy-L-arabinose transferase-like glycosyltransferase
MTGRHRLVLAGLAAFLFATAPFVVFMLLNFQLDLPLAAMVALALYALVRIRFTLRAADVRYGGERLPSLLVNWIVRNFDGR